MERKRKSITTIVVAITLLAAVLFGLPLFGDRKRNPENYLTGERSEQLEAFVKRLLGSEIEVAVLRQRGQEAVVSGGSDLKRDLELEIATVMESQGWELLEVQKTPQPMVTLGSYSGRTWAIYVYSPKGPATARRCSPQLFAEDWYYCEY